MAELQGGVDYDARRRGTRETDGVWIHASVMPIVNLLSVFAYVAERDARSGESE